MQSQVKYGLSSTRIHESEQNTAVKSSYQGQSPSRFINGTPSLKSQSRCTSKIQEARESINLMINEMTNKRNTNNEAVEYVRSVNNDALAALQNGNAHTPRRGNNNHENRHARATSGYNNQNGYDGRKGSDDFNLGHNDYLDVSPIAPHQRNLQQQNFQLRRALELKVRQNNDLLRRIRFLQNQNAELRGQLGHNLNNSKNMRSTNYNSVYDYTNQPQSAQSQRQNERNINYGHNRQRSNIGNNGRNNVSNFGRTQHSPMNLNNQSSSNLLAQLDELKYENERLRHQAVDLLKHY